MASLVFVAATASCNPVKCGPGLKQVQEKDGSLLCVPVDAPAQETACDVDGGNVIIVAGKCVSKISCDPATTQFDPATNQCVGIGTVTGCAPCGNPASNKICVSGKIWDFVSNTELAPGARNVRVSVWDPFAFLADSNAPPLGEIAATDKGCYTIDNLDVPAAGLIAVGVQDPAGTASPSLALAGVGLPVTAGKSFKLDAFVVERSTVAGWEQQTGLSYANGAYVALYVNSPVETGTTVENPTTGFTAGVKVLENGVTPASTRYFGANRSTIDPTAMQTSSVGGGIVAVTRGAIRTYSGMGGTCGSGTCKWEARPGGSTTGVIFFNRFKECTTTPNAPSCM
jgi:hypothetical protein